MEETEQKQQNDQLEALKMQYNIAKRQNSVKKQVFKFIGICFIMVFALFCFTFIVALFLPNNVQNVINILKSLSYSVARL